MKVRIVSFEGTPEEFSKVKPDLFDAQPDAGEVKERSGESAQGASTPPTTLGKPILMRILTRRPLSPNLRKVFKTLLKADAKGMSTKEIADSIEISLAELAGVFGAFGRRVANTPGVPDGAHIVGYAREYNDQAGKEEWRYWLQPAVREIFESGAIRL